MKKLFKVFSVISLLIISCFLVLITIFFSITKDVKLDKNKLIDYGNVITVCDCNQDPISNASIDAKKKSVCINDLNKHTINAFIASEDRRFYEHNGLNWGRMFKALAKNLASRSFKEGASTISQQLIKNTHLSNEKTIERKLKEIKLTLELEKSFDKDQILEMYLNTIYFGHNCYGLQSASNFYFGKNAENLSLNESAVLVGLLSSPNNYSPINNLEKSTKRRNLVLNAMKICGYIDETTYKKEISAPITLLNFEKRRANSDYVDCVLEEIEDLGLNFYDLRGAKIITYMNQTEQRVLDGLNADCDYSYVICDHQGGVTAFRSTLGNAKRQPGSTIKPLLVYAPAIEEKVLSTYDMILDEKIDYSGFSPQNYDKKYRGYVSVLDSIKLSLNVPAVKTLNALGISNAQKYAEKLNINIDEKDKNLSLALGGMTYGVNLKGLCDGYSTFANDGNFYKSSFIDKILDENDKIIYENKKEKSKVFRASTCSLINEALLETTKSGSAKRVGTKNYDVATKTGTCGDENGNTDAYCIAYTTNRTLGVWLGSKNNKKIKVSSSKDCCAKISEMLDGIYFDGFREKLEVNSGVVEIDVDRDDYKNGKIVISDKNAPPLSKIKIRCAENNLPKEKSTKFTSPTIKKPTIHVENGRVKIELCQTQYYSIIVNRHKNGQITTIFDGKCPKLVEDDVKSGVYEYSVIPYYYDGKIKHFGKEIVLDSIYINNDKTLILPNITKNDWYN